MKTLLKNGVYIFIILFLICQASYGQDCNCRYIIPPGSDLYVFDAETKPINSGESICIKSGRTGGLIFKNIEGSPDDYITIKNCGGQVIIGGPNVNNGILFIASKYFRLTGTGYEGLKYGIKINETQLGTQGIAAVGLSTDMEIDHIEIERAGYTGIMIKSDPSCDNDEALRPNFTLKNIKLHHLFIHDLTGEGIYLGNSFYTGTKVYCNTLKYPHDLKGVRIYDNLFENTGREAIQVGGATKDVEVYNNEIYNYGTGKENSQNGGIQFGVGTTGKLYNNFIKKGSGAGIVIQGIGENYIYNNIVVDAGYVSININTRPTPLESDIVPQGFLGGVYVINNHFINPGHTAINEYVNEAPNNVFYNNLIVTDKNKWKEMRGDSDWEFSHNLILNSIEEAGFVNPESDDYTLKSNSPAIGKGKDVSKYGLGPKKFNNEWIKYNYWHVGAINNNL